MVCRQIWRCRRRRCPRPFFVALVVAACLFYQTLTIIGRKTFTLPAMPGILQNPYVETQERDLKDVPTVTSFCLFSLDQLQRAKEIEDSNLKHFDERHVKRAILYAHPSINLKELQLYQRILTRQGYTVLVPEENEFNAALRQEKHYQGGISPWDLVICIPGRKRNANCMSKEDLSQLQFYQKVNLLPEIRHFLCRKEGLCQITRTFPELQLPVVASICSEQYIPSRTLPSAPKMARLHEVEETYFAQPQDWIHASKAQPNQAHLQGLPQEPLQTQDFASIIKAYVLVTSFKPLRAFIHSMGLIWHPPNKKHHAIKLPVFFAKFFKDGSSMHTFTNMKEAIIKLLVAAEVISEMSASESGPNNFQRYKLCFQFLTFDFGFNHSSYPVLLEVHEHFDFRVDDNLRHEDQNFKECLLEDAFRFLSPNMSATVSVFRALQDMIKLNMTKDETGWKKCNHCLSLDEIHLMMNFVREIKSLGRFELLFPSTSPKLQSMLRALYQKAAPRRKLDAVLGGHSFISSLLEQFQNLNRKVTTVNPMPRNTSRGKEITNDSIDSSGTGKDKVALSHIRQICTRPQLDLNPEFNPKIKDYYSEVPFDVVTVKISFSHDCQAHLDKQNGPSYANYPLGLGINHITVPVTEDSDPHAKFVSSYTITVYREDRPSMLLFDDYTMCGFIQDCGLIIRPGESCGLQPLPAEYLAAISQAHLPACESGDSKGEWIVPCLSCSDNRTCDWRAITWQPYNCQHPVLMKPELQQCVDGRKVLFIGDSTNRGIMYYLIERVNDTLQEWHKVHSTTFYANLNNGETVISYSYYPQFWININHRPTFEKALENLIYRSHPLENTDQTILVVGGVQWLNSKHLHIIHKVLKRANLLNIRVVIKSIGMGFHLPVDGIRSLSQVEVQQLWEENVMILDTAKLYGYEVVDTFSITMGRYKEFLQGKCGCHFHEVVKVNIPNEYHHMKVTLSRYDNIRTYINSQQKLPPLHDDSPNASSPYHVKGPVNQMYSEILLSRMCASKGNRTNT